MIDKMDKIYYYKACQDAWRLADKQLTVLKGVADKKNRKQQFRLKPIDITRRKLKQGPIK